MSMIRLTAVKIRHPLTIIICPSRGLDERPVVLSKHISWYNMSHLSIQHKNETTPDSNLKSYAQTKLRSIDSCQNGTCVEHNQKNNNVGSGPLRYTIWHFPVQAWLTTFNSGNYVRTTGRQSGRNDLFKTNFTGVPSPLPLPLFQLIFPRSLPSRRTALSERLKQAM